MKNLLAILLLIATVLFPLDALARASTPLQSPMHADFVSTAGGPPSLDKVRQAIIAAGAAHGWRMTAEQPGQMSLHNVIRGKHTVDVNVSYTRHGVDVIYMSSDNLDYAMRDGVAYIHPKYMEWVNLLLTGIVTKVSI